MSTWTKVQENQNIDATDNLKQEEVGFAMKSLKLSVNGPQKTQSSTQEFLRNFGAIISH